MTDNLVTSGKPGPADVDSYIAQFPPDVQAMLEQIRQTIRAAAPEATEAISYQMPTFRLEGNLIHFAAFKHHLSLFPAASGVAQFQSELTAYKTSKGTIQFPTDQPLPRELIERITRFRVEENLARAQAKKARRRKR